LKDLRERAFLQREEGEKVFRRGGECSRPLEERDKAFRKSALRSLRLSGGPHSLLLWEEKEVIENTRGKCFHASLRKGGEEKGGKEREGTKGVFSICWMGKKDIFHRVEGRVLAGGKQGCRIWGEETSLSRSGSGENRAYHQGGEGGLKRGKLTLQKGA